MISSELTPEELQIQLEQLHDESFGWALSCCRWDETDAEDVLQTTYLKVVSRRARFGGRSAFKTWLFGVIRQTAREHLRRARSQRARVERLQQEMVSDGAGVAQPHDPVEGSETSRALLDAMATLTAKQREVLHLVFYQDCTVREAAEVMGVSLGTARVHYDRGKKKLRAVLSDEEAGGGSRDGT